MKKIFSTMVVVAALFAGYSAYNTQEDIELAGLSLANVEALASSENESYVCEKHCKADDNYTCIIKYTIGPDDVCSNMRKK